MKRYELVDWPDDGASMSERPDGEYVRYEDVAALIGYALEICDLCEDDYPADSERGLALARLRAAAKEST